MNKLFIYSTEPDKTWKYLGEIAQGILSENKTMYEITVRLTPKKYLWTLKTLCEGQSLNFLECVEGTNEIIHGAGKVTAYTFWNDSSYSVDITVLIQSTLCVKPMTPELNTELTID